MKKRNQMSDNFKWKTSDIYKSEKELEIDIEFLKNQIEIIKSYKGKLNNPVTILEYFKLGEKISLVEEHIGAYLTLRHSEDLSDQKIVQLLNVVSVIASDLSVASSFEESELLSLGVDFLKNLSEKSEFKNYKLSLLDLIRNAPHVLNEREEELVSQTGEFSGGYGDVFDNIDALDVKFQPFIVKNKKYEVNNSNFGMLLENKNPEVRINAFKSLHQGYMNLSNTIATNYIENLKVDKFYSKVYRFKSSLDSSLFGNNLPESIYTNLINKVNENVLLLQDYLKLRKKLLNLKTLNYSDLRVAVATNNTKYNYDLMCKVMLESLQVLGKDYTSVVQKAINENWIDVYPNLGKDTGAFSLGVYGVHPYILLNTVDNMDSMFTLTHEMGHTMHSYLSDKSQPYELSHYPIFLAEIASTTNEVLLLKHLYKNCTQKQEKIYLLDKYLQMFRTTIFRQTMFSEFEDYAHKLVENGEPISKEILTEKYAQLNKFYHGASIKPCKEIAHEWLRIPHFYRGYYVFKYATGLVSAICIASKILESNDAEDYLNFLSSGGSDYPNEILKRMGVDLSTDELYKRAFEEMKWALKELKQLVSK